MTVKTRGTSIRLVSQCVVEAYRYSRISNDSARVVCPTALWDTGASVSVISARVAEQLKLIPTGLSYISGFDGKKVKTNTYRIDLELSENIKVGCVEVVESPMIMFDLLIGMDVISLGDFYVSNRNSSGTTFSFSVD